MTDSYLKIDDALDKLKRAPAPLMSGYSANYICLHDYDGDKIVLTNTLTCLYFNGKAMATYMHAKSMFTLFNVLGHLDMPRLQEVLCPHWKKMNPELFVRTFMSAITHTSKTRFKEIPFEEDHRVAV